MCDIHTHHPIIPHDDTTHDDDVGLVVYGFPLGRLGLGGEGKREGREEEEEEEEGREGSRWGFGAVDKPG